MNASSLKKSFILLVCSFIFVSINTFALGNCYPPQNTVVGCGHQCEESVVGGTCKNRGKTFVCTQKGTRWDGVTKQKVGIFEWCPK